MNTIIDLQGIGDKTVNPKGSNVLPSDAVKMFQMQGSLESQTAYPMYDFMKVSIDGNRVHQMKDWLDQSTLKSYFTKKRSELLSQKNGIVERIAKDLAATMAKQVAIDADDASRRDSPLQYKANSLKNKQACINVLKEWGREDPHLNKDLIKSLSSLKKADLIARVLLYLSPPFNKTFP